MAKQSTLDPVEGQVYLTHEEHRRIISVNSAMVTPRVTEFVSDPKPKKKTWVTYSNGGNTNHRCQLKSFRKWIRVSGAIIHGEAASRPAP